MSKKKKRGNIKGLFDEIMKKKNLNEKEALIIFHQLIDTMKYMHKCHKTRKYII